MRILLINLEFDCAGVAWNLRNALNQLGHEAVHIMRRSTNVAQNTDRLFTHPEDILDLVQWADVLHFNQWIWTHVPGFGHNGMDFAPFNEYGGPSPFEPYLKDKRVIFHFHGGRHQLYPEYWVEECRRVGASIIKCDPISRIPYACWIPNVLDIVTVRAFNPMQCDARLAIMGDISDSRRNNLHVSHCLHHGDPVRGGIPYRMFWKMGREEAIRERCKYPISLDNLTQGFVGMWSWESMAMGQCTMARLGFRATSAYSSMFDQVPPIINVENADDVVWWFKRLSSNRSEMQWYSNEGLSWVAHNMTQGRIARMFLEHYWDDKTRLT